ncbi:uncharacterized protein LOC126555381 [Aphis gossypii]|uniref:uncharacterized protein LOC126555381 n=1 Tax=Aphis gossypii TaxID=80765 RepID=UPI002158B888|nr:uncharacterized protein LOC126555381 [Aphis gossypii]
MLSRPASSLSECRPGTGHEGVLPNLRPNSRLSRPQSRLPDISMCTDLQKIWESISNEIENNMNKDEGTLLKDIGYFTVAKWGIHQSTVRKPVFIIQEQIAKDFNLKRSRPYNSGIIQERCLNFSVIARNCNLNVDMVIDYYKEVVSSFKKLLSEGKNCELPFPNIGKIRIKNKIITMNFYQEFLERQSKNFKNQIVAREKNQAIYYDPDWNTNQFENRKRPCSAMSTIISRPASSLSNYRPGTGYVGVLPNLRPNSSLSRPQSRLAIQPHKEPISRPLTGTVVQSPDDSKIEKTSFIYDRDETLCHKCNIGEYRLRQIDNITPKKNVSRDIFMKGADNIINGHLNTETLNKRKDQLKQTSDYNYNTAKELLNSIENEKNINRKKNVDSYILKIRPASINIEKKNNFKQSLLDQIKCNKIKKETDKIESLKNEKLMQTELSKSLYDEIKRNIEARNRSKKKYSCIIDEYLKKKNQFTEELKKKDITIPLNKTFVFGPDPAKLQKLNNCGERKHVFPKSEDDFNIWLQRCCNEKLFNLDKCIVRSHYAVCHIHFDLSCESPGTKKLKKGSLPTFVSTIKYLITI